MTKVALEPNFPGTLTVGNNSALGSGTLSMANNTTLSFLPTNFTVGNAVSVTGTGNVTPPSGTMQILSGIVSDGTSPGTLAKAPWPSTAMIPSLSPA